nr:hypothetical protein Itr_chr02CG08870 [Ipomoea trifida]
MNGNNLSGRLKLPEARGVSRKIVDRKDVRMMMELATEIKSVAIFGAKRDLTFEVDDGTCDDRSSRRDTI